jgi:hypothetical protein
MSVISHKIADQLFLIRVAVAQGAPAKPAEAPTNHIVVVDCSGSMYDALPKIREQLKKKLPKLLRDGDTLSMIWFSGRGQFGALFEGEPVPTLAELADVSRAIDRWLKPVGLTGFKEPLVEAAAMAGRLAKNGKSCSLFFMSDGCDNQWPRADVLKAVEKAAGGLAAATVVEYGFYADRPLLAKMAEAFGGAHIHAADFDMYQPLFEAAMQKRPIGGKRVEVELGSVPIGDFAFALTDGDLVTFGAEKDTVHVPEGLQALWYLSRVAVVEKGQRPGDLGEIASATPGSPTVSAAYAALSLYASRMQPDVVYPILRALGDVTFVDSFSTAFGKQKISEFMAQAQVAAFEPAARFTAGRDPSRVPADDAFTVLDLLRLLAADEDNRVLLDSPAFKYARIGRGRVDADEALTAEEQVQVQQLTAAMRKEKSAKKLKELQAQLDAITSAKREALKFAATPAPEGYPIASLTFNEERPNVSFLVRKEGTVDLAARRPAALSAVPDAFPTFIWRNYAVLKDGLVNVDQLPVKLTEATFKRLKAEAVPMAMVDGDVVINVHRLPPINRRMVKGVSAQSLFELEYQLTEMRARQKVYNAKLKELKPAKESKSFALAYGQAAADWLKEQGFTDYSGFAPKVVQAEATDFYMGKQLEVKLKGYATLPTVKDVEAKVDSGKPLTGAAALMGKAVVEVRDFFAKNPEKLHAGWIEGKAKTCTQEVRGLLLQKAQIVYAVIVGQVWFSEFKSLDETTLTVALPVGNVTGTVELKDVEIKI